MRKDASITFLLDKKDKEKLIEMASESGTDMSTLIRIIIRKVIDKKSPITI